MFADQAGRAWFVKETGTAIRAGNAFQVADGS